jgi:hypothetical protein
VKARAEARFEGVDYIAQFGIISIKPGAGCHRKPPKEPPQMTNKDLQPGQTVLIREFKTERLCKGVLVKIANNGWTGKLQAHVRIGNAPRVDVYPLDRIYK